MKSRKFLINKKEAFKSSEDGFKRRENELREKDLKIQESLIKFSKYLEENEMKKNKAIERRDVELKEISKKKEDIELLDERYITNLIINIFINLNYQSRIG
jgi:hypothetical protein